MSTCRMPLMTNDESTSSTPGTALGFWRMSISFPKVPSMKPSATGRSIVHVTYSTTGTCVKPQVRTELTTLSDGDAPRPIIRLGFSSLCMLEAGIFVSPALRENPRTAFPRHFEGLLDYVLRFVRFVATTHSSGNEWYIVKFFGNAP